MRYRSSLSKPHRKVSGFMACYYRYCALLRKAYHGKATKRCYFLLREDFKRFNRYQQQTHLLWEHRLQTLAEVQAHKSNLENQIEQLARQRKVLYRQKQEPERAAREEQIQKLTKQIKALRHEFYICTDIEADAAMVQEKLRQTYGNKPYPIAAVESTKQIEKVIDVMREISPIPVLPKNEVEGFCYDAERQELVFCAAMPPQELLQRLPAEIVMAAAESAYAGISENELLRQTAAAVAVEVCGRLGLPMPPDAFQTLEGMKEHIPDGEERRALEKVRETAVTFGDAVCKRLKLERGQPAPQREER